MAKKNNPRIKPGLAAGPSTSPSLQNTMQAVSAAFPVKKLCILLAVISIAVYANTLQNGYVLDDFSAVKSNKIVSRGISAIPQILATPYRRGYYITSNDTYRPLSLMMFAAEFQLSDGSPVLLHLVNILFFAGCVIVLFLFLDNLFEQKRTGAAFVASLLFALHPIHTEVAANIKSRDELLCFFFAFLAMNIFMKYIASGKWIQLLAGCFCFFLSFMSKETIITFLAIVPLVFFFYRNENKKRSAYITAGTVAVAIIFLLIRSSVLRAGDADHSSDYAFIDNMLVAAPSAAARLATETEILGLYLKQLIAPYPLICDYSYNSIPFVGFGNIWVWLSLCVYGALSIFAVHGLVKKRKDPFVFAVLFFLITLSLFSNIPFLIGTPMAERLLFFPSVGFCFAFALALEKWLLKALRSDVKSLFNPKLAAVLVPVCLLYGGLAVARNANWKDDIALYSVDVKKSPNDSRLAYYYGAALVAASKEENEPARTQMVNEGISYLRRSIEIYPDYANALTELGTAFFHTGNIDSSEKYCKLAFKLNAKDPDLLNTLAGVYFNKKDYPDALEVCKKSIVLDTLYAEAYANEGLCFLYMGRTDSSLYYLYKSIAVNPKVKTTYGKIALTYQTLNKIDSAKKYEAMAK